MKIISKSRIGMASDKLDCDEFMKNQNKIRATLLRIMRNSAGVRLRCSEIFNQVLDKRYHLFKLIRKAVFFIKIKISLEITEM